MEPFHDLLQPKSLMEVIQIVKKLEDTIEETKEKSRQKESADDKDMAEDDVDKKQDQRGLSLIGTMTQW